MKSSNMVGPFQKQKVDEAQEHSSWIELSKVKFSYDRSFDVIHDISMKIDQGQFVGIIGPNGSGKTTVARLLNGDLISDSGDVRINGLDPRQSEQLLLIKRLVTIIHADAENQLITSTVFDEISFALQAMQLNRSNILDRCEQALEVFHLREFRNAHPFFLSVGEQFRLLLAAGWVRNPKYIVLDEVLSMLDSYTREHILQMLLDMQHERNLGIILLTHRLSDLISADRIIILENGKIAMDDTVSSIFSTLRRQRNSTIDPPPF